MVDKKQSHKSEQQVLRELSVIIEQIANHVMITDSTGLIEYVNPSFEHDTGYSSDELIGQSPKILKSGQHDKEYYINLWQTILAGKDFRTTTINKKKSGEIYYADQTISPIKDENGIITHFIAIWEDISERIRWENKFRETKEELAIQKWGLEKTNIGIKQLYKELESQNKELLKLDQLKSDFVSTVSHELRTPLAISTEGINLILDGLVGDVNEKQRNLLTTSRENLTRLNLIINDLLDISKIEAGKVDLHPTYFNIVTHLSDIVNSYQPVAAKKKISLITHFPPKEILLFVDKNKLTQVVTNLLSNAYKFTPEGGCIDIELALKEYEVVCSIKNTGEGIDKENLPKLFKKFQQIGRQEGPGIKGTGLGLTISKSLVEIQEGRIWVESDPGHSATFYFSLPLYTQVKDKFINHFDTLVNDAAVQKKSLGFIIVQQSIANELIAHQDYSELNIIMNRIFLCVSETLSRTEDKAFLYDLQSVYILLPDTKPIGLNAVISRIKKCIDKNKVKDNKSKISLNIKFGYSLCPDSANTREGLIKTALADMNRQKTILVVDDDAKTLMILNPRLKNLGYCVTTTETGEKALALIKESKPDLVILDIMMPGMNGYEVFGRMKEEESTAAIPIVFLTAKDINTVRQEAPQIGEVPVFSKTGDLISLIELINKMVS